MPVATEREHGLFIGAESADRAAAAGRAALETLDLHTESKGVLVQAGPKLVEPWSL